MSLVSFSAIRFLKRLSISAALMVRKNRKNVNCAEPRTVFTLAAAFTEMKTAIVVSISGSLVSAKTRLMIALERLSLRDVALRMT